MSEDQEGTFDVGDKDLYLLGLAAGLAARYQARRKSGVMRGFQGFPQSDVDALEILQAGMDLASTIPADDVPVVYIAINAQKDVLYRLLEMAGQSAEPPDDEDDEDDDRGDDWKT